MQRPSEILFRTAADDSEQPALFWKPRTHNPAPLLVGLHAWSADCRHKDAEAWFQLCAERNWVFLYPDFRGPSVRPEAGGSDLVIRDIVSAADFAMRRANVDPRRVYAAGGSGGGHVALLLAGRAPRLWAAISAWVPISDLAAWHEESSERGNKYAKDLEKVCGGQPGDSPEVDREYERRSPLTWLENARGLPLDINAGIRDGHQGSVPVDHALRAFNAVALPEDRLPEGEIAYWAERVEPPEGAGDDIQDPAYGAKRPLFRRTSGAARVTVFDGGHELIHEAAIAWLEKQAKAGGGR